MIAVVCFTYRLIPLFLNVADTSKLFYHNDKNQE